MRDTVLFLDTTLRDGEQTPGVSFHLDDKVAFARALEALGVDMIEAGFAGSSQGDFEAVRAVARTASKSPWLDPAKPASIMSTPSASSARAKATLSSR